MSVRQRRSALKQAKATLHLAARELCEVCVWYLVWFLPAWVTLAAAALAGYIIGAAWPLATAVAVCALAIGAGGVRHRVRLQRRRGRRAETARQAARAAAAEADAEGGAGELPAVVAHRGEVMSR